MSKPTFFQKVARHYAAFRGSPFFISVLTLWVGAWLVLHHFLGLDKDLGEINLILSVEAGISTALLVMDIARNEQAQRKNEEIQSKQMKYMLHILEAILEKEKEKGGE